MQEVSYQKNLSHYRAYQQSYRAANSDTINSTRREKKYHQSASAIEKMKIYQKNNHDWLLEYKRVATILRRTRKRNASGSYTAAEWQALKEKYDFTCLCCGRREPEIKITVDHIIPIVKGGSNNIENLQPLCLSCNSSKQAKTIDYRR